MIRKPAYEELEQRISELEEELIKGKRAEEALRESESHMKSISDNLPDGMIYQIIAKADGARQFTYLSDSVRKLHGISPEEGMADPTLIYRRIHEDDIASLMKAEDEALKTLSTFRMEVRVREAQRLGAGAYVKKPYVMETIGMAIRNELNR